MFSHEPMPEAATPAGRIAYGPVAAALAAAASLAVELADEIGTTLVGFLRDGSFNIYTHPYRVAL